MTAAIPFEHTYAQALPDLSQEWSAAPAREPRAVIVNDELARDLGLDPDRLRSEDGLALLTGAVSGPTYAQAYSGHQFGQFSPVLGDGRALLLGELVDPHGKRHDLHLKGSGRTPFSRGGDGKAPLGPMLREHLLGEAMHALGIPTTRGLAVVTTGERIQRSGPDPEPGAILTRVAASHLRVGTFEFAATQRSLETRQELIDYAIQRHWPAAASAANPPLELLRCVVRAQAELIAQWMLVGFVHGVMNTDNMTISGETIDYGPCAFVDTFSLGAVFSSIDRGARYAYGRQADIGLWNLSRFAEALVEPVSPSDPDAGVEAVTEVLREYAPAFREALSSGLGAKLGLDVSGLGAEDRRAALSELDAFTERTFTLLQEHQQDFTAFFRALSFGAAGELFADPEAFRGWDDERRALLGRHGDPSPDEQRDLMASVNPVYIPRNHHLQRALERAEDGDMEPYELLLAAVRSPFQEHVDFAGLESSGADPTTRFTTFCGT
ncbi:YdiU family protein [Kocuria palustris]|uniref:protein adenylyltransferase SelO n=1 Tax=Kocuria palustris TaxID=71999 RepID=UPI0011A184BB|nr:YdiU family protein [Kocuria palustris]